MDYLILINYGIQIILMTCLLVALACKSWVLLTACLTLGLVLFGLACFKLIQNSKKDFKINSTQLQKIYYPVMSKQQHPYFPPIQPQLQPYPQPQPPVHRRNPHVPVDEAMARQVMLYADRTQGMQPGHKAVTTMRLTGNQNQGQTPFTDGYMVPIPNTKKRNPYVQAKDDPEHAENPMNSLSYLHPS